MKEYYIKEHSAYLRYQDFPGTENTILFIHGLGCAGSFDYSEVAAQSVFNDTRCIIVDLLGAGYSDKPTEFDYRVSSHVQYLKSFIEDLNLNDFNVFGHSLGGPIAIELTTLFYHLSR
ncbi:alpha/beta hydrolase [uncultured Streptococcus sp.]|uniref:alpha/beta fold hydrolase n=1 Tax=uncultured Streptococcus sp. TaxID=83427 RepID=UPI0028EAC14A|nr:alpha/beta hydrolase [uncultured Streptococcus sp.]